MNSSKIFKKSKRVFSTPPKKITILGSTGSIGQSTLEIVRQFPKKFQIYALSCNNSTELLANQIKEFNPKVACVGSKKQALYLQNSFPKTKLVWGMDSLSEISCDKEVDMLVAGIVGAAGLKPTYSAILEGKNIVFANKEPLVMAGELFVKTAKKTGAKLLPADSEHNAIFQSIHEEPSERISKLFLTASGGPFRDKPLDKFDQITIDETLNHPTWKMGKKISVDSATMMNKGLEIIEARWLFDTPVEKIEVIMQRESFVHSIVEFVDGSFLAHMGPPDMKIPISYCLAWPERLRINRSRMNPLNLKKIHFEPINQKRFPCLNLSLNVAKKGGSFPAVLNGANEEVVSAFLKEKIKFLDIFKTLSFVIEKLENVFKTIKKEKIPLYLFEILTLEDAIQADQWGRKQAIKFIEQLT
tara:strand:+ start:978 stop:2222 length:1245 start_codon:yes stop_codon:yes gene_type:complete